MKTGAFIASIACVMLVGCKESAPSGQVLARVNGTEITRRDLMIEAVANGLPADTDVAKVRVRLLDDIMDRQLAVDEALRLGVDRTPDYQARLRRTRSVLLMEALGRRLAEQMPTPTDGEVRRFIAVNPQIFRARRRIMADVAVLSLDKMATAEERVGQSLVQLAQQAGAAVEMVQFDSATLSATDASALAGSSPASPAILQRDDAAWIVGARYAQDVPPAPWPEQLQYAKRTLAGERSQAALESYIRSLRQAANISVQNVPAKAVETSGR